MDDVSGKTLWPCATGCYTHGHPRFHAHDHDSNSKRIYRLNEMDADHVTAWSRGGATDAANCQMLCKTHNRAKGNR